MNLEAPAKNDIFAKYNTFWFKKMWKIIVFKNLEEESSELLWVTC